MSGVSYDANDRVPSVGAAVSLLFQLQQRLDAFSIHRSCAVTCSCKLADEEEITIDDVLVRAAHIGPQSDASAGAASTYTAAS